MLQAPYGAPAYYTAQQFDTSLGTLTQVTVLMKGSGYSTAQVTQEVQGTAGYVEYQQLGPTVEVTGPGFVDLKTTAPVEKILFPWTQYNKSPINFETGTYSAWSEKIITDSALLTAWQGPGTVDLDGGEFELGMTI